MQLSGRVIAQIVGSHRLNSQCSLTPTDNIYSSAKFKEKFEICFIYCQSKMRLTKTKQKPHSVCEETRNLRHTARGICPSSVLIRTALAVVESDQIQSPEKEDRTYFLRAGGSCKVGVGELRLPRNQAPDSCFPTGQLLIPNHYRPNFPLGLDEYPMLTRYVLDATYGPRDQGRSDRVASGTASFLPLSRERSALN